MKKYLILIIATFTILFTVGCKDKNKTEAIASINNIVENLKSEDYSEENWTNILTEQTKAIKDIDEASSKDSLNQIIDDFEEFITTILTIEEELLLELSREINSALRELNSYVSNPSYYVKQIIKDTTSLLINATTVIEVEQIMLDAIEDIDIQLIEEENISMDIKNLPYYGYMKNDNPRVTIEIEGYGSLVIELFPEVAENTVNNFLVYASNNDYRGAIFHRIIKDFMIQGGEINKTLGSIKGEFASNGVVNDLKHFRGVISMARTMFPNSASSQFFVVHKDSPWLDGEYAGFGGLVEGFDILDQLASVNTGYQDRPLKDIVISNISVSLNGYVSKDVVYM